MTSNNGWFTERKFKKISKDIHDMWMSYGTIDFETFWELAFFLNNRDVSSVELTVRKLDIERKISLLKIKDKYMLDWLEF